MNLKDDKFKERLVEAVQNDEEFREELKQELVAGNNGEEKERNLSRRDFLKKAGLSVAGFGALAYTGSTTALKIDSSTGITLNEDLEVGSNGDLDMKGSKILNIGKLKTEDIKNTRKITINGEDVAIGHRVITSRLPLSDIENSDKITIREGDIYQQIQ